MKPRAASCSTLGGRRSSSKLLAVWARLRLTTPPMGHPAGRPQRRRQGRTAVGRNPSCRFDSCVIFPTVALPWARRKRAGRAAQTPASGGDARRLVGREDNDPPAPEHMLPKYWGETLSRRELNLDADRVIRTSGVRGVHEEDAWNSDCEIHEQPNTFFWPPVDQYDFVAAFEHAPAGVWPSEADDLFERLADEYRGYAPNVWPLVALDVVPNLVEVVREIVETDSTGRYFMHYDAEQARRYWANPPSIPAWIPTLPTRNTAEQHLAAHWSAGFAFTRMRRQIRWERFPLRKCTLCGTQMRHSVDSIPTC
jgi:hypothetical protein